MRVFYDSSNQCCPANEWPNVIRKKLSILNQDSANNTVVLTQWFLEIRNKNPIVGNESNAFILSYVIEYAFDIAQRSPTLLPNQNIYLQLLQNLLTHPNLNYFIPELLASPASLSGHEHPYDFATRIGFLQASAIFASAYRMIAQNLYCQLMQSQQEVLNLQQEVSRLQQEIKISANLAANPANAKTLDDKIAKLQETIQQQNMMMMQQTQDIKIMIKDIGRMREAINKKWRHSDPQEIGLEEAQTNPSAISYYSSSSKKRLGKKKLSTQSMWEHVIQQGQSSNHQPDTGDASQFSELNGSSRSKR